MGMASLAPHILFIDGINLRLYRDGKGELVFSPGPDSHRRPLTAAERQRLLAWLKEQFPEAP